LLEGQGNPNGGAAAGTGLDFQAPAMRFDGSAHNSQAQPTPLSLGGFEEGSESPRALFPAHAV